MKRSLTFIISVLLLLFTHFVYAETELKEFKQELSDSVITTKITAKFTEDRNLNPLKISVSTKNGIVTLNGYVKNKEALVVALNLVKNTKGVKKIEADGLIIKQVNTAFTDAYITTKVEAAILKAKVFDDETIPLVGINAATINGVVTLTGQVKHEKSIIAILNQVNSIRGVKKIISNLQVKKDEA